MELAKTSDPLPILTLAPDINSYQVPIEEALVMREIDVTPKTHETLLNDEIVNTKRLDEIHRLICDQTPVYEDNHIRR